MGRRRGRRGGGRQLRLLAGLYGVGAAGTVGYWGAFLAGRARTDQSEQYLDFERSFLLADAYLAAMSGAAAVACWRRDARALPLGLMASGASIYLGCMDVVYNLRHGKYRHVRGAMAVEVAINVYSLGLLDLRARVRLRHALVNERGEWQQRMQAVLYHHGLPERREVLTRTNRAWVEELPLPAAAREQITVALAMIDAVQAQLAPATPLS